MEESLGCWFNMVFINCDKCGYGNDAERCAVFRKANYAKLGYEEETVVDNRNDPWKGGDINV